MYMSEFLGQIYVPVHKSPIFVYSCICSIAMFAIVPKKGQKGSHVTKQTSKIHHLNLIEKKDKDAHTVL